MVGGLLGLVGLWLRRDMAETEHFEESKEKAEALKHPLRTTLREHPKAVAQLIGFTMLSTLCYYTFFSALAPYAVKSQGADDGQVFTALSIATALFVVLQYPFGWLSDRFGRKPQMLVWTAGIAVLIVPLSTVVSPRRRHGRAAAGVLHRARALQPAQLHRPRDHERALPRPSSAAWASAPGTTSPSRCSAAPRRW